MRWVTAAATVFLTMNLNETTWAVGALALSVSGSCGGQVPKQELHGRQLVMGR